MRQLVPHSLIPPDNRARLSLAPGARLGPYEITAQLGAGGMGEVYKARDTRLDRTVAIKILSDTLAGDPQFRARIASKGADIDIGTPSVLFQLPPGPGREATTSWYAAAADGQRFLVNTYVEGAPITVLQNWKPRTEAAVTLVRPSRTAHAMLRNR